MKKFLKEYWRVSDKGDIAFDVVLLIIIVAACHLMW